MHIGGWITRLVPHSETKKLFVVILYLMLKMYFQGVVTTIPALLTFMIGSLDLIQVSWASLIFEKLREGVVNGVTSVCHQVPYTNYQWNHCVKSHNSLITSINSHESNSNFWHQLSHQAQTTTSCISHAKQGHHSPSPELQLKSRCSPMVKTLSNGQVVSLGMILVAIKKHSWAFVHTVDQWSKSQRKNFSMIKWPRPVFGRLKASGYF